MLCARYSTAMMIVVRNIGALATLFFVLTTLPIWADHAVNINTADKTALMTLTGIGEVKAQAIIDYRTTNGPFETIEEIQEVSGIGPSTYANIKDHITVSGGQATPASSPGTASPTSPPPPVGGPPATEPQIAAFAGKDRIVITGADVALEGKAFAKDGEPLGPAGIRFLWNFGDGKTAEGPRVMHRWAHPGRYVVTLDVSASMNSASHRIIVTAQPAEFALSMLGDGSAVIENNGSNEADLSLWHIRNGNGLFTLPEDTVVLMQERIIIPPASLGFAVGVGWSLLYPNGDVAETAPKPKPFIIHAPVTAVSEKEMPAPPKPEVAKTSVEDVKKDVAEEPVEESTEQSAAVASMELQEKANKMDLFDGWMLGLVALTSIGAIGAFFASRAHRRDWTIVEEKP